MDIGTEALTWRSSAPGPDASYTHKKKDADVAEHDPLIAIAGGGGVSLYNSWPRLDVRMSEKSPGTRYGFALQHRFGGPRQVRSRVPHQLLR